MTETLEMNSWKNKLLHLSMKGIFSEVGVYNALQTNSSKFRSRSSIAVHFECN